MQPFFAAVLFYISHLPIIARTIYAFASRILFILFFLFIRANSFGLTNFDCPRDKNKKRNEKGYTSRLPQSFTKMDKIPTQQSQAAQLMTKQISTADQDNICAVEKSTRQRASIAAYKSFYQQHSISALDVFACWGFSSLSGVLLKKEKIVVNLQTKDGATPLFGACYLCCYSMSKSMSTSKLRMLLLHSVRPFKKVMMPRWCLCCCNMNKSKSTFRPRVVLALKKVMMSRWYPCCCSMSRSMSTFRPRMVRPRYAWSLLSKWSCQGGIFVVAT